MVFNIVINYYYYWEHNRFWQNLVIGYAISGQQLEYWIIISFFHSILLFRFQMGSHTTDYTLLLMHHIAYHIRMRESLNWYYVWEFKEKFDSKVGSPLFYFVPSFESFSNFRFLFLSLNPESRTWIHSQMEDKEFVFALCSNNN